MCVTILKKTMEMKIGDKVILRFKESWSKPKKCWVYKYDEKTNLFYGVDIDNSKITRCLGKEGNPMVEVIESSTLF